MPTQAAAWHAVAAGSAVAFTPCSETQRLDPRLVALPQAGVLRPRPIALRRNTARRNDALVRLLFAVARDATPEDGGVTVVPLRRAA